MSLSCVSLCAGYGKQRQLHQVSLSFRKGEVVALLGANGSGKTTLLRCLLDLIPLQSGEIRIDSQSLSQLTASEKARALAYVPQLHRLSFGYTAVEVVLMGVMAGRSIFSQPSLADKELARYWLQQLNVNALADKLLTEVSGGQRQLVMIARAMAQQARFILLDEPTNGLDYANQHRLLALLRRCANQQQGLIFTTHDPTHARRYADRVILLNQGEIVGDGHPQQVLRDEDLHKIYDLTGVDL